MIAVTIQPAVVDILLVEDNHVDADLVTIALNEVEGWPVQISLVNDGDQAVAYLLQTGAYSHTSTPDLVVLDLNLPKRSGTEVLKVIRNTEELRDLKVIVLSSSPVDVIEMQVRHWQVKPDCCFTKPMDLDEFMAIGGAIRKCYEEWDLGNCESLQQV